MDKTKPLREAFESIIFIKGIHNDIGLSAQQIQDVRYNYRNGKLSADKMRQLLTKAGWEVVQEERWAMKVKGK